MFSHKAEEQKVKNINVKEGNFEVSKEEMNSIIEIEKLLEQCIAKSVQLKTHSHNPEVIKYMGTLQHEFLNVQNHLNDAIYDLNKVY